MDLAELRLQQTPVRQNAKCDGCVHYNGSLAKSGACEVGQAPSMCGSGKEPKYGYAPLADIGPDEIDDLATPLVNGSSGTMNEHGAMEQRVVMKTVCLGDEDLTIAKRIHGVLSRELVKSIGFAQGEVGRHCGAELAHELYEKPLPLGYVVAKALRDQHFAPRKQRKYDLEDVMDFLKSHSEHTGITVGDDAYAAAGITKSESDVPFVRRR